MNKTSMTIGAGIAVVLAGAYLVHSGSSPMTAKTVVSHQHIRMSLNSSGKQPKTLSTPSAVNTSPAHKLAKQQLSTKN